MLHALEDTITPHLDPNERLLWSGQPRGGIRLRAQDALIIPFSLMWCGFAIFWEFMAIRQGAPLFFMLWGIPFVCAGLFFVFGRFFFDAHNRAKTYYAVTDERILIISGIFSKQIKSLPLRTLSDISLNQRSDCSGTISFGPTTPFFPAAGWPGAGRHVSPSFDFIESVKEVHDIIRNAQRSAHSNT